MEISGAVAKILVQVLTAAREWVKLNYLLNGQCAELSKNGKQQKELNTPMHFTSSKHSISLPYNVTYITKTISSRRPNIDSNSKPLTVQRVNFVNLKRRD